MSNYATPLTPEQQNWEASRAHTTSELLHQGASFDELGRLTLNSELEDALHLKYVDRPTREEFIKTTPEGEQIGRHIERLQDMQRTLHSTLGNAVCFDPKKFPEGVFSEHYQGFIEANEIAIFSSIIDSEQAKDHHAEKPHVRKALETAADCIDNLNTLTDRLTGRPDLRIGSTVNVTRTPTNGQPEGVVENNWIVDGLLANGKVTVKRKVTLDDPQYTKPGQYITKSISIAALEAWNPLQNNL